MALSHDASGASPASGDGAADGPVSEPRAHARQPAMHADPESPASREEAQLLPDEWLKVKTVPANGNLSPGVYYPTVSKRFVDARHPVPSPTEFSYCFAFVRLLRLLSFVFCLTRKSFTLESNFSVN